MSREQAQRLQEQVTELARRNQAELQRLIQTAVRDGMVGFQQTQASALNEMQRRMDQMAEQLEELRRDGAQ